MKTIKLSVLLLLLIGPSSVFSNSDFSKSYKVDDNSSNNCAIRRFSDQKVELYIGGQKIGEYDINNNEQMESYRANIRFWVYDSGACRSGYKIFLEK